MINKKSEGGYFTKLNSKQIHSDHKFDLGKIYNVSQLQKL
jgi:hypothetical protein